MNVARRIKVMQTNGGARVNMKRRTFVKRRTLGLAQENTSKIEDKTSSVVEII